MAHAQKDKYYMSFFIRGSWLLKVKDVYLSGSVRRSQETRKRPMRQWENKEPKRYGGQKNTCAMKRQGDATGKGQVREEQGDCITTDCISLAIISRMLYSFRIYIRYSK